MDRQPRRKEREGGIGARLWLCLLSLLLLAGCSAGIPGLVESPPATYTVRMPEEHLIRLAWFYKPPAAAELDLLGSYFDLYILTSTDEPVREALREQGVKGPFLQYFRFDAIHDPGSCTAQPWRNQVANRPGDFCALLRDHPDWFLRDSDGRLISSQDEGERFVLMDPGVEGWRAFWLKRALRDQAALGWDGVFLDNVEASLDKYRRLDLRVAKYPTDESYQQAVESFLSYLHEEYSEREERPLYANIIELRDTRVWNEYMEYLDGYMDEAWVVDWEEGRRDPRQWEEHLRRVEQAQRAGKEAILVAQGRPENTERQHFAFASYLLVNEGGASFRYSDSDAYEEVWLYTNYQVELGAPLRPRYRTHGGWRRDFTGGVVWVNPRSGEAAINLY